MAKTQHPFIKYIWSPVSFERCRSKAELALRTLRDETVHMLRTRLSWGSARSQRDAEAVDLPQ